MTYKIYGWPDDLARVKPGPTNNKLKLSIVIPTLNQACTIEDTLASIIYQDYNNYEIIVMDGGSSDNTESVIKKYSAYIAHYTSESDGGQSCAINKGFQIATGDVYAWINSDDFYLPYAFSNIMREFTREKKTDIVVGSGEVVTWDCSFLKQISSIRMSRENLLGWHNDQWIMQQCCFWRAELWEKSGGVDEDLQLLMDYDLWLRFAEIGNSATILDNVAVMRYYKEAKTLALKHKMDEETAYVYAKNHAYKELRALVKKLNNENKELRHSLDLTENKLIFKALRRMRLNK